MTMINDILARLVQWLRLFYPPPPSASACCRGAEMFVHFSGAVENAPTPTDACPDLTKLYEKVSERYPDHGLRFVDGTPDCDRYQPVAIFRYKSLRLTVCRQQYAVYTLHDSGQFSLG